MVGVGALQTHDTRPAEADRPADYKVQDRGERLHPRRTHPRYAHLLWLRRRMSAALDHPAFPRGGRLLDLGCGSCPYRPLFDGRVRAYVGADLPGNAAADLDINATGRVPAADGAFDAVLSSQVLEHVPDPQAYLGEAHRLLAGTGVLLLSTHGRWLYHPDPGDYRRWTVSGLIYELQAAGFETLQIWDVLGTTGTSLHLLQDSLRRRVPRRLRAYFYGLFQSVIAAIEDRRGPELSPNASVYVVLARKRTRVGV